MAQSMELVSLFLRGQRLTLSTGSKLAGYLPEDGGRVQSSILRFKFKRRVMDIGKKSIIALPNYF